MNLTRALDALLAAGLGARLTRFVVIEELSGWLIRDPAHSWADRHTPPLPEFDEPRSYVVQVGNDDWRHRLVSGLDCPFCVGTWVHLWSQAIDALVPRTGPLRTAWRVLAISQTAAYVLGHLGSRLGDAGYDESDDDPED